MQHVCMNVAPYVHRYIHTHRHTHTHTHAHHTGCTLPATAPTNMVFGGNCTANLVLSYGQFCTAMGCPTNYTVRTGADIHTRACLHTTHTYTHACTHNTTLHTGCTLPATAPTNMVFGGNCTASLVLSYGQFCTAMGCPENYTVRTGAVVRYTCSLNATWTGVVRSDPDALMCMKRMRLCYCSGRYVPHPDLCPVFLSHRCA